MAFYVLTHRRSQPDRLDEVIEHIRSRLANAPGTEPGRRAARVFQRLDEPTHLLTVSEWIDERAFATQHVQSTFMAETDALGGTSATFTPLIPLIRYEHMARRGVIGSCVTITARPEVVPELQAFLVGPAHQEIKALNGVVSREVFAARDKPGTFLVVHSWQALSDLKRFRSNEALALDLIHERLQTTMVAFTGTLTAQFSAFQPRA